MADMILTCSGRARGGRFLGGHAIGYVRVGLAAGQGQGAARGRIQRGREGEAGLQGSLVLMKTLALENRPSESGPGRNAGLAITQP